MQRPAVSQASTTPHVLGCLMLRRWSTCCQCKSAVLDPERCGGCLAGAACNVQHCGGWEQQARRLAQRRHARGKQQARDVLQVVRRRPLLRHWHALQHRCYHCVRLRKL
jgi:hypothetical protein